MKFEKTAVRVAQATTNALWMTAHLGWGFLVGTAAGITSALLGAGAHAAVAQLGDGPNPASMTSAQAPQAALVIHYNNKFTQNLAPNVPAQRVCNRRKMPENAGQKYQDYMYPLLGLNTANATEGTVGNGISITPQSTSFTLGQWADYINFSDFVLSTTIDPMLENVEKEMAKRLGRTIQRLTLTQLDALRALDPSVGALDATSPSQTQTRNLWTEAAGSLRGRNVQPLEGLDGFGALIHPFFTTDKLIDTSNNSVTDVLKHTAEGQLKLNELPAPESGQKTYSYGGITFLETTELTTSTPAFAGGKTAIRSYLVGNEGLLAVSIGKRDRTDIGDGDYRNLKLWRGKYAMGSSFDPAGMIGGACSYNVVGTWGPPPDTTARIRAFDYVPQTT